MKIDKGLIYDAFSDICITVNENLDNDSKEHNKIHDSIRNAKNRIYEHLGI